MTDKKLTLKQRQWLTAMRDKGWFVRKWIFDFKYYLHNADGDRLSTIPWDTAQFLEPFWAVEYDPGDSTYHYTFRRGAEISDKWRTEELARGEQAELAKKEQEEEAKRQAAREGWTVFNEDPCAPYQIQLSGEWPFGASIEYDGITIANLVFSYSTEDKSIQDVLKREGNKERVDAVKQLLRLANDALETHGDE